MFDVVVLGGGLAGTTAALWAASQGAKVAVAHRGYGATALSTGAWDIAYSPALSPVHQTPRTLGEHIMDIIAHRPRHPYGVLGLERTAEGLREGGALVSNALAAVRHPVGAFSLERENLTLPSTLGTAMPAATAALSHLGLDLGSALPGRVGLLQPLGDPHFGAARIKVGLAHDVTMLTGQAPDLVPVPVGLSQGASPLLTARLLDDQQVVREWLSALAPKTKDLAALIVPPVLGLDRHPQTLAAMREGLGVPVVEALGHVPSVPGVRLQRALDRARTRAHIASVGGIAAPLVRDGRLVGVRTDDTLDITGAAFVLATGRFVSGGVAFTEGRCAESLFELPVASDQGLMEDDTPLAVVRERPEESHPLMTTGIMVDADLRPLREAAPAHANLFAAGMVVGGFASRYVLCADGVALATGVIAARGAVAAAGARAAA